jgi:predicted ABC-type ATPase
MVEETPERFANYFVQCGMDKAMIALLKDQPMTNLKAYLNYNPIPIDTFNDDARKSTVCDAIMKDSITKLSEVGSTICRTLKGLSESAAFLNEEDRLMMQRILFVFGVDANTMNDEDMCTAAEKHFGGMMIQARTLQRMSERGKWKFPKLRTLLSALMIMVASISLPTCDAQQQQCTLQRTTLGGVTPTPFVVSRLWVQNELQPEVEYMSQDQTLVEMVKANILEKKYEGQQITPVVTFLLGGAGAGKTTRFKDALAKNREIAAGVAGAAVLNSDDIMALLPGYNALLDLGTMNSIPISNQDAAATFHTPAADINAQLTEEFLKDGQSFIFDGTGNNLNSLQKKIQTAKRDGFKVNMVVVTALEGTRQVRVADRAVTSGRYVPVEVVEKGRDPVEWENQLELWKNDGLIDEFVVYTNN